MIPLGKIHIHCCEIDDSLDSWQRVSLLAMNPENADNTALCVQRFVQSAIAWNCSAINTVVGSECAFSVVR